MIISGGHHSHIRNVSDLARRIVLLSCECLPSQQTNYSPWTSLSLALQKYVICDIEVGRFVGSQLHATLDIDPTECL